MEVKKLEKESTYLVDSLNNQWEAEKSAYILQIQDYSDEVQKLQYEVKLAESQKESADRRANAVQSTAEKIRKNTSITIENKSVQDTVSVDKK
jgi:hypothetical protein